MTSNMPDWEQVFDNKPGTSRRLWGQADRGQRKPFEMRHASKPKVRFAGEQDTLLVEAMTRDEDQQAGKTLQAELKALWDINNPRTSLANRVKRILQAIQSVEAGTMTREALEIGVKWEEQALKLAVEQHQANKLRQQRGKGQ